MNEKILATIILILLFLQGCKLPAPQFEFSKVLWTVDWSSNDKYIAIGGNSNELKILSGIDFKEIKTYPIDNTITKLKWHPNNNLLAISTQFSKPSLILDIKTEKLIKLDSVAEGARGLGWNFNGKYLAVGDYEGQLIIYSVEGEFLKKIKIDPKVITGLSWHPSKNIITTVGTRIGIYNLDTDSLKMINPREEEVLMLCVEWHPSGSFFVTGDYGDYDYNYPALLQYWDSSGKKIREIKASKAEYRNLRWSSNGTHLATASEKVRIWSKEGEEKLISKKKSQKVYYGE